MSLLAPRPQDPERASVLLPTIKCSSCAGSIPLSALGEHVCRPKQPSSSLGPARNGPRPPQISIPDRRPTQPPPHKGQGGPSALRLAPGPGPGPGPGSRGGWDDFQMPPRPPYASSSSSRSSSGNLSIPSPGLYSPQARTPSPTNPFFPHPNVDLSKPSPPPPPATVVHGLGLGVGAHMPPSGPYASTVPPDMGRAVENMPDTTSGGGAGMAGVGRRAFAAAAWGVRAGVALAAVTRQNSDPNQALPQNDPRSYQQPPLQSQPQSQYPTRPTPQHQPYSAPTYPSRSGPSTKEPVILPRVPLSGRQRTGPSPSGSGPPTELVSSSAPNASPPRRTASSISNRSTSDQNHAPDRRPSMTSNTSDEAGNVNRKNSQSTAGKLPFFEKYKQLVTNSASGSGSSLSSGPGLGLGKRLSGDESGQRVAPDSPMVESPIQDSFDLDDDDEGSSLPWATPSLGSEGPLKRVPEPIITAPPTGNRAINRYPTDGSVTSSSSGSGSSGRRGQGSGSANTEEVVTPSQSWEGLAERASGGPEKEDYDLDERNLGRRRLLAQIGEGDEQEDELEDRVDMGFDDDDDEGERLVFGATPKAPRKTSIKRRGSEEGRIPNSNSASTITSKSRPALTTSGYANEANRSRTVPDIKRTSTTSTAVRSDSQQSHSKPSSRRTKTCAKCNETVGGDRRFVERDGVVLCERDWKLLYLPSCRKCNLPIEKSAVSSSDGQLKGKWHKECFGCSKCGKAFEGDSFYVLDGKPWCQLHYHEENGTLCAAPSCRKPIEGPCILSPSTNKSDPPQRFHPGHLKCDHRGGVSGHQSCKESMDEYYDIEGGRYCERHVGEVLRKEREAGRGGGRRAEKRMTRLVELPVGGF